LHERSRPLSPSSPQAAHALWTVAHGRAELRPVVLTVPDGATVQVRALVSGISRGTESLVFQGHVPESEWARMRCPFQEGEFPFPVKYGYAMVGALEETPNTRVFALYPHQTHFVVPKDAVMPIPDNVSTERAVLAPQMETALNATWDGGPRIGDRIAVVGGGVIGCLVAYLCGRIAGTEVTLIDVDPSRGGIAKALGVAFAIPADAPKNCDLVFHASGTSAGLELALTLAGFEATIIELSWYGANAVTVGLGGAFHSQRLSLLSSQVGSVAPARRPRWPHGRRLAKALSLCADPTLDCLVAEETPFAYLPQKLPDILGKPGALCHLVRY
jgi:NADPH:quinone reductase-like Zn-dependent oxidoreductase